MKAAPTPMRSTLAKGAACGGCRARKVRCTGELPVCQTCVKHWVHEGRIDRDCCPVGTPRTAKGASKRKRRESGGSNASTSSTPATALSAPPAPYMSPPATPPLVAVVDETLPWFYDPLTLADVTPSQDLWEYLESYEAANAVSSTPSLFEPTPLAFTNSSFDSLPPPTGVAPSLFKASSLPFSSPPINIPSAKKLIDNPTPILSAAEFEVLLAKSMQYTKVVEPTPVVNIPTSTLPASFRPTYNFDSGMTALADLAAMFKLGVAAGAAKVDPPRERRVSTGMKSSVESLDNVFLNEPYYHM
ncbi:hypothetical protein RQP46_008525 [Phenoliferia psychrophenolica]